MIKDLTGQKFGRLTAIEFRGTNKSGNALWLCKCDCGNETVVRGGSLKNGHTKSCGCLKSELDSKKMKKMLTKHGLFNHRLYGVWSSMKERCYNPKGAEYLAYGGRGIDVCDEWKDDFKAFYDWAISHGYDENAPRGQCTIDRINNDKGYNPENCRWVPMLVQASNRRKISRKGVKGNER